MRTVTMRYVARLLRLALSDETYNAVGSALEGEGIQKTSGSPLPSAAEIG